MFKIESYIAPLLMGYVDKYVKLRQEDFQLSLWGGDVVLNNLDLRLDALQNVLHLPVMFKSGHIHELRIHVPWTKLGSEPVVITINTIECILKVRDTAYGDSSSSKSGESQRKSIQQARARIKPRRPDPGDDLPPGYLQSLMNRVVNNVNIIMNNLILKFVEDDIVLSLNVKSAECYSADDAWNRGFLDLTPSELILRKVVNFCDLTVCLDKANTSGRIESYQEPILYRSSVSCRLHMTYESITAKVPSVTKFNVSCEKLDLSLSDTQLPMFVRLIELCIALYYGTIDFDGAEEKESDTEPDSQDLSRASVAKTDPFESEGGAEDDQGWMSWAWSFVPQILPEDEETLGDRPRDRPQPPLVSIGFYIHKASINFKLTEKTKEGGGQFGSNRVQFHSFLLMELEGLSSEILMKGLAFFDAQCGISALNLTAAGVCICGARDAADQRSRVLCQAGESVKSNAMINYISQSLFDPASPENQGTAAEFVTDGEKHLERYTEQYGLQKYGAFWFDYLYFMRASETTHSGSRSSVTGDSNEAVFQPEMSIMKILIGPCRLNMSSTMHHRIQKFIHCATDHQYQPYTSSKTGVLEEGRPEATEAEIEEMEAFIPTRSTHLMLIQPTLTLLPAEHSHCDVARRNYKPAHKKGKEKTSSTESSAEVLPSGQLTVARFDYLLTSPMYPRRLVRLVSNIAGPSSNLLYHCHSHTQIKIFSLHAGLLKVEPSGSSSHLLTLIPPCSGALSYKHLLLPKYWTNVYLPLTEWLYELPQVTLTLTKASLLLLVKMASSWLHKDSKPRQFMEDSLLQDLFPTHEAERSTSLPVLELSVGGCEMKCCSTTIVDAYTGSATSLQCVLYNKDPITKCNRVAPIFTGPADTNTVHSSKFFKQELTRTEVLGDCLNFTLQLPKNRNVSEAPAVILIQLEGCVGCVDPALLDWLMYAPCPHPATSRGATRDDSITVDLALAQAASPLQANMSQVSVHSSSSLTNPTGSRPLTQSHTHTPSQFLAPRDQEGAKESSAGIGAKMVEWFRLLKMLHIQTEIRSSCIFFPESSMAILEPSMDIPVNFHSLFHDCSIPNTLVVCLPCVTVHSAAAKPMSVVQEIPITTLEGSIIGDKLPWSVKLENFTVYSLHKEKTTLALLKPLNLASTVAVTCKYTPPTSDTITALGLCLHIDMQPPIMAVSKVQTRLCVSVVQNIMTLVNKGTSLCMNLLKPFQPQKHYSGLPPISSSPEKNLMSADNEALVTDQSETLSRDEGAPPDSAAKKQSSATSNVKFSLWTQLLIPKVEVRLYGEQNKSSVATCVTIVAEEFATSVDIQQVYSKVKASVGSFNISHQQKREGGTWERGACEGILLSCRGELPRDTLIVSNKLWVSDSPTPGHLFPASDTLQREQTSGFLNFTFTQALCKNVNKKMKKMNMDLSELTETEVSSFDELYFHEYISEVCLKTEPCDIVLYVPVFETLLSTFEVGSTQADPGPLKSANMVYPPGRQRRSKSPPLFSSCNLPLLYANIECVRVILPDPASLDLLSVSDQPTTDKENQGRDPECKSKLKTTIDHDMLIGQIQSISIQPHADNPLPREAVEKDLYHRALHSGVSQQPGSSVEDRQYQAQLKGCSLCTGCWGDLVRESRRAGRYKPPVSPGVQIPALEWNTFLPLQQDREEIHLIPLASGFDLCLVMAPAVVYTRKDAIDNYDTHVLVCGYAAEVNVTSDLDLYLSTNQVQLVTTLTHNCLAGLHPQSSGHGSFVNPQSYGASKSSSSALEHPAMDSGVGSDLSTVTGKQMKSVNVANVVTSTDISFGSKVMPFNILLTAGRISFTVYSHKVLVDDKPVSKSKANKSRKVRKQSKGSGSIKRDNLGHLSDNIPRSPDSDEFLHQYDTCSEFDFMRGPVEEEQKVLAGTVCLKPFLYLYVAQPHTIISCLADQQRVEMSCYDIILKGTNKLPPIPVEEQRLLPDRADFSVYWVETRAGCPHPKTGIPPSLYTLQLTDFLQHPANATLKLERPVKINLSLRKVKEMLDFVQEIVPVSPSSLQSAGCQDTSSSGRDKPLSASQPGVVWRVGQVELVTGQMVVQMDTGEEDASAGFLLSTSSARVLSHLQLQTTSTGQPDGLSCEVFLKDVLMKTVMDTKARTLLGPTSLSADVSLVWQQHSGPASLPQSTIALELGVVPIFLGQEHLACLQRLFTNINHFVMETLQDKKKTSEEKAESQEPRSKTSEGTDFIVSHNKDDLRTAGLEYVVDPDGSGMEANPGEIVFCDSNSMENGSSTMTWTYNTPRVLSHITVMPVPFGLSSHNKPEKIPCVLQYLDQASGQYLGYIDFALTENETFDLPLPEVKATNSQELVVAQTWRVVISPGSLNEVQEQVQGQGDKSEEKEERQDRPPLVLPASLAACMSVSSCFVPGLVPVMQGCVNVSTLQLHLLNHLHYLGSVVPCKLAPYTQMTGQAEEQEFAVLTLEELNVNTSHLLGRVSKTEIQVAASVGVEVLEYRNLTMDTVLEPTMLEGYLVSLHKEQPPVTECNCKTGKAVLRVGRGAVHTLTTSLHAWSTLLNSESENRPALVFTHIMVCNDTQHTLRFGQVGTDENLVLTSREMHCYSWRSHKSKQLLHVCMDQPSWKWCDPFDITSDTSMVRTVHAKDQNYSVIIKIKQITNNQKQIIITGHLVVSSRLSQNLEVNLMTSGADNSVSDNTSVLGAGETIPSYVVEQEDIIGIKFRVHGLKTVWSQEIHINGDKMRENGLVKIPLGDRNSYIHVWCRIFCQHFKDRIQTLVLLSPLYILRSHLPRPLYVDMDTPRHKQHTQLEVIGQGQEFQLHCVGGDITHKLAFRLAPTLAKSSPSLVLSTGLIEQVEHQNMDSVDIDTLCYSHPPDPALAWPYCFNSDSMDLMLSSAQCKTSCVTETDTDTDQPSVDLSVRLSEFMPGCSTLLVDITPWCLITNLSSITVSVLADSHKPASIPHGRTYTPPMFSAEGFRLGVYHKNKLVSTALIPLSEEEVATKRYSPDLGKVLFVDGYVHTLIHIPGDSSQAIFFTVCSSIEKDMRVVTIRERFAVTNLSSALFEFRLLAVPLGHAKVSWKNHSYSTSPETVSSHKHAESSSENVQSLLTWSLLGTQDSQISDFVHYIAIREKSESCMESGRWSLPLRLSATSEGARLSVSVCGREGNDWSSKPYCITAQLHQGVTYLVLEPDQGPVCVLTNKCSFPILFGQALINITLSGTVIQEEAELIDELPTLDPGSSVHYTMPYINNQYPAADVLKYPRMHFCANLLQEDGSYQRTPWSTGVDVMSNSSTFVQLPGVVDVKIQSKKVAMVTHIVIEPIGKAEISAKEIRSRIRGGTKTERVEGSVDHQRLVAPSVDVSKKEVKPVGQRGREAIYSVGLFLEQVCITLLDETSCTEEVRELLALSCDDVYFAHFPVSTSLDTGQVKSCVSVSVGRAQLDNQQYGQGQYDFPVLLVEQGIRRESVTDLEKMTVTEKHAVLRLSSFLNVQCVLAKDGSNSTVTESVEVSIKPLSLYIDDTFIYRLLKEIEGFIPNSLHYDSRGQCRVKRLPKLVKCTSQSLSRPVRIHYFCIQPMSMLLSVHASMKLFLASDHTPLSFSKFERKDLYTSSHQLIRALAMHYASGAIFRAGIVVGSLEILGNPTGLVRSVGTGVADMLRLPYAGISQGPGAFIGGVSRGMSSLLKNVSAGMITSVTNFASSVSRNMDRLSLDSGHLQRQEENRRNRPVGVSDGLMQGLTGFGLSLLGAVAGLADQPIQSLISSGESERRASTSATATGLVAGMGKGLVGIVTKPIGGAAEFVSQTGQGILHGTGLSQLPDRRHQPLTRLYADAKNGILKHIEKIFSSLPTDVLLAVDGLHLDLTGQEVEVTLLLTPEILFVVSCEEDAQQQAFSVRELEISECPSDESLITVVWNDNFYRSTGESDSANKDRVAAFIDSAPTLAQPTTDEMSVSDSQSESLSPEGAHILVPQYQFRIPPTFCQLFLTTFQQARNNQLGHGFPV